MSEVVSKTQFEKVVEVLRNGGIVAVPTDTVFGIGVLADNMSAISKMKVAKGRPETKPFPLMVADVSQMHTVAFLKPRDEKIANQLTPGALTLILNKKDIISDEAVNGVKTIAIRIPDDEFMLKLLRTVGPMFVTSANISGEPACNDHNEVLQHLDGRIELIVEGEAKSHVASTIIDCTADEIKILRQGDITMDDINRALSC